MIQVRECFLPRAGWVFGQADYSQLELYTWASVCKKLFGFSDLGDALVAGLDPHTEMAASVLQISAEEARRRRKDKSDKLFDEARQIGKNANFGLCGGLGSARFIDMVREASDGRVILTEPRAKEIKAAWGKQWREGPLYLARIAKEAKQKDLPAIDIFTGRVRGNVGYADRANDAFQGLGAACAKEALFLTSMACYTGIAPGHEGGTSPLKGARICNFVHDEIIFEMRLDVGAARLHAAAHELERLMILGAQVYLTEYVPTAPPVIMAYWSKDAEAVTNESGLLIPWNGSSCAKGCKNDKGKVERAKKRIHGEWLCGAHKEAA